MNEAVYEDVYEFCEFFNQYSFSYDLDEFISLLRINFRDLLEVTLELTKRDTLNIKEAETYKTLSTIFYRIIPWLIRTKKLNLKGIISNTDKENFIEICESMGIMTVDKMLLRDEIKRTLKNNI